MLDDLRSSARYLANVGGSAQLLSKLFSHAEQHLAAGAKLLNAIERGRVEKYLAAQFRCPD
jgi:hypothetical protein